MPERLWVGRRKGQSLDYVVTVRGASFPFTETAVPHDLGSSFCLKNRTFALRGWYVRHFPHKEKCVRPS